MPLPSGLQSFCWKVSWQSYRSFPYMHRVVSALLLLMFYLSSFFAILISMFLRVDLSGLILFEIFRASWTWMCVSSPSLGKFSVTMTSNKFSALALSFPFGTRMLIMLQVVQEVSYTHFLKLFFPFSVQLGDFHYSVFLFTNPVLCIIQSTIDSFQCFFNFSYCILQTCLYIFLTFC